MCCVCPSVVGEPWLLLGHQWVGLSLKLTGCDYSRPSHKAAVALVGLWCQPSLPFVGVLFVDLVGCCYGVI